jgi:hypothetical protein
VFSVFFFPWLASSVALIFGIRVEVRLKANFREGAMHPPFIASIASYFSLKYDTRLLPSCVVIVTR